MSITLATAQDTVSDTLGNGLTAIDTQLQAQFDSGSPDQALVMALNSLRSRYVFDQMRVTRAQITALDIDPATQAILGQLDAACTNLGAIQTASAGTNDWINEASSSVDTVYGLFGKIASL